MTSSSTPRDSQTSPSDQAVSTDWLNDDERTAWIALLEVGFGLFDVISRDLKQATGLTLADYEIFHLLSQEPTRSLRVGTLAERMLASRTRLSQQIDRLSAKGLVERKRCPGDGRAINVVLTDEGHDLLVRIAPIHLASVRERVFEHWTAADVKCAGSSLSKLADSLRDRPGNK